MKKQPRTLTEGHIRRYALYLQEQERSAATIRKYLRDLTALQCWLKGAPLTKCALIDWKEMLVAAHAPATVNSMLGRGQQLSGFYGAGGSCASVRSESREHCSGTQKKS